MLKEGRWCESMGKAYIEKSGLKNPDKNHRRGQFQGGLNIIILLSCQLAIKLSQSQISCREISTKTWL
ncbi:hypothetical protein V6Z11_A06G176000 [Gossypium hirsutum]